MSASISAVAGASRAMASNGISPIAACFLTAGTLSAVSVGTPVRRAMRWASAYTSGLVSAAVM